MKKRIDILLVEKQYAGSREKAKTMIIEGIISVNGQVVKSASDTFEDTVVISIVGNQCPYVSRGGYKLEKAINSFAVDLHNCVCMDVGASTGGFTDVMLQQGADYVFSVDVGYGQFDWKLRNDSRVKLLERTNARFLTCMQIDKKLDFVSVDVSFISLKLILPVFLSLNISEQFGIVALIKPQFEAGRSKVGKNGVVRDKEVHIDVIRQIRDFSETLGLFMSDLTYSPIKGPKGNIEFLCYLHNYSVLNVTDDAIIDIVNEAHSVLV